MEAGSINLKNLFTFERRHLVPLFQRPYVWTKEGQWQPLWEDIVAVAERELAGLPVRPHFLGAVVLDQIKTSIKHIEARLVIDGQQRLTTLQVLLAAFRDLAADLQDATSAKKLDHLTRNDDASGPEDDERFKVWPTNLDQGCFRAMMDPIEGSSPAQKVSKAKAAHPGSLRIADAYEFFLGAIKGWLHPEEDGKMQPRIDALLEVLRERIHLVVIELGEKDDAQVIFETLNARGSPLSPADLVKNFLFHRAADGGAKLEALYDKHWKTFDETSGFWRQEVRQGRLKRPRVDLFLQHYLTLLTSDEVPATHLFAAFKDFAAKNSGLSAEDHLQYLSRHAKVFRSFSDAPAGTRAALFHYRIGVLDTTTIFPFLLGLYARFGDNDIGSQLDAILVDLESYLVRRMICELPTNAYNKIFLDLLEALDDADGAPLPKVRAFLLGQSAESARWPTDDEFRKAWLTLPAYKNLKPRPRVRMVLEALEAATHHQKSEDIVLKSKLTVEHLMPQSWGEHWPLPEGQDPVEKTAQVEAQLHRFGNLTLLTKKLNPSVSNSAWEKKRPEIVKFSMLALNSYFQNMPLWNESTIEERTQKLFELALLVWPRPAS